MTTPAAAVKVVVRIRPLNAYEQRDGDTPIVRAYSGDDGRQNRVIVDGQREETFEYATSLSETANECDVAKAANAQQLVQRVVDGRNATVLAYGQTAAGKTHTIDGLLPTVIDRIFKATHEGDFETSEVSVSYLEIYNEQVFDLGADRAKRELKYNSKLDAFFVDGLLERVAKGAAELNTVRSQGEAASGSRHSEARGRGEGMTGSEVHLAIMIRKYSIRN